MYDNQAATPSPKRTSPAMDIINSLLDTMPMFEVISVLKECESILVDRMANDNEIKSEAAAASNKVLHEARNAFGMNLPQTSIR